MNVIRAIFLIAIPLFVSASTNMYIGISPSCMEAGDGYGVQDYHLIVMLDNNFYKRFHLDVEFNQSIRLFPVNHGLKSSLRYRFYDVRIRGYDIGSLNLKAGINIEWALNPVIPPVCYVSSEAEFVGIVYIPYTPIFLYISRLEIFRFRAFVRDDNTWQYKTNTYLFHNHWERFFVGVRFKL